MGKARHCPEWEEKLSLYVDGVLNPFDENAVEAHLARCAGCRETVALWRAVGRAVRCIPQAAPPAYLREWILASTSRRPRRALRRARFPWRVLAPAIGVALVLGWLTLPRPAPQSLSLDRSAVPAPGSFVSMPLLSSVPSTASPHAPLVVVLPARPVYRTASPVPYWIAQTRLSVAPGAFEAAPAAFQAPGLLPAATATTLPATEPAFAGSSGSSIIPTIGGVLPPPTPPVSSRDFTDWLHQPNAPRTQEQRAPNGATVPNQSRSLVPVVIIEWR